MSQMLALSQAGTVDEYTVKFSTLKHQILLEDPYTSEVFFVERYLAGLRPDIRTAVVLHCPVDTETASLLATLQETELESERVTTPHKHYNMDKTRSSAGYTDRYKPAARIEENMKSEAPHWDDKLEALRAYRKSKGLCFTCGEKWNKTHKCPSQIPLHVMEELLEVLQSDEDDSKSSVSSEDDLMLLTPLAASSAPRQRRTMRLHGMIGKQHVLILVDSGANASFINAELAQ